MAINMNEHLHTYQAMFLLDNGEVREQGFNAAREWVKSTLEKHGATVQVLRLWAERPLAYPIQGRNRATYVHGWFTATQGTISAAKREMYLLGPVFRLLVLREDEIPAEELAFGIEEVRDADVEIPEDVAEVDSFFAEQPVDADEAEGTAADGEAKAGESSKATADAAAPAETAPAADATTTTEASAPAATPKD